LVRTVPRLADDLVSLVADVVDDEGVVARGADHDVGPSAPVQGVVSGEAGQQVDAAFA
jgi:hypothetical protein